MRDTFRFGRRLPLPSSLSIVHDLLVMEREEMMRRQIVPAGIASNDRREVEAKAATPRGAAPD
jgi:hypothetical protein